MDEKLNKNAKVEQLTEMFLSREEEKGLFVKDPLKDLFPVSCYQGNLLENRYKPSEIEKKDLFPCRNIFILRVRLRK